MIPTPTCRLSAGTTHRIALVCAALLLPLSARAQQALTAGGAQPARSGTASPAIPRLAVATPRTEPVELDGRLTEPAWASAIAIGDFTQTQPNQGLPATQRTEVRFLVDGDALFIGARMYDSLGAAGVRGQLVRRDTWPESDWIDIIFDTFHDHLGQVEFVVNPSGVKQDAYGPGGSGLDPSWNAVWDVVTRVDSLGWVAEFRIPFAQLRFPHDSIQTWGLQVRRLVHRLNEFSSWSYWPPNQAGGAIRYGHLEGLRIAATPGRLEIMPYVVGRQANVRGDAADPFYNPSERAARFGVDLKYLLSSNLTLNATVNPDFGQVEVDPAVVNLGIFETMYPERRPFFVENQGLLGFGWMNCYFCSNTWGLGLLHSRRIGRAPQGASLAYAAGDYADVPENTRILGAAKITGRLANGTSVGILNAVTAREFATVATEAGGRARVQVEPLANYAVARFARDFAGGSGQVRFIGTSVVRDLRDSALAKRLTSHSEAAGLELQYWWHRRTFRLMANVAYAQVAGDSAAILRIQRSSARYFQRPDRGQGGNGLFSDGYDPSLTAMRGWSAYARLSKESGNWIGELNTNFRSPGFEANDLAYNPTADFAWMSANVIRRRTQPSRLVRDYWIGVGGQQGFNFDGDLVDRQLQASVQFTTLGYWGFNAFYIHRPARLDDRLARGGPVLMRPAQHYWYANANTDSRKRVALGLNTSIGCYEGRCGYNPSASVTLRPASNVRLSVGPSYSRSISPFQWVTAVDDPTATATYGRRYVFADLDQRSLSMDTRLNITFTPTLTLELYAQPLIVSARYTGFKEYDRPRSLQRSAYGVDRGTITPTASGYTVDPDGTGPAAAFAMGNPDFNFRSLRGNAVVRWEFRPGSTLFLVWTQSRSATEAVGNFDLGRDVDALFSAKPDNIFLVKMSYWLGL
jgi:hypothetical protein